MSESIVNVVNAARYRVLSTPSPTGVVVEITIATPAGERPMQAFWMPPDAALGLAAALMKQAKVSRSRN